MSSPAPDGPDRPDAPTGDRRSRERAARAPLASDSFLRPSFTLEQVRTFLAVASREHVTHAAKVLRLSQPAVTQQVQLLERALGVRLLERVGRSVRLTDAGVEVAGACLLVMRSLENVEAVARAVRGLDLGSVTVGASELAVDYFLPQVITEFVTAHPRINAAVVVASADQIHQHVAAGRMDCALVDGQSPPPELHLTHVQVAATEALLVASRRDLPATGDQPVAESGLAAGGRLGLRLLEWGQTSPPPALLAEVIGNHGEQPPRLQIGSMEAARRSVLGAGGFTAVLPAVAIQDELRSGALVRLGSHTECLPVFAVRRPGPDSPAVEALWRIMSRPATGEPAGPQSSPPSRSSPADAGHRS
ncbi:MAG: LysR family transcriptional regulator [Natronosporangium sp.]